MKILAIETSADDTAAAVVENTTVLSSVKHTQLEHADWGGIVPSIARRDHQAFIDKIIEKAMSNAQCSMSNIDAIAVTTGPGLAIALEVGINKAKELASKYNKPLIAVNHIEGHLLSPLATTNLNDQIPTTNLLGLVVSGGHTELIFIEEIGKYKILAQTLDDALGEALDKAARILGMPYPGGALLEKAAALGNPKKYLLPLPMAGREDQNELSYSGLKAAFGRLVKEVGTDNINDLAASFQNRAFEHLIRIIRHSIGNLSLDIRHLLVGGGVIANQELRKRLTSLGEELIILVCFAPMEYTGDNAVMIGIAASFKYDKGLFVKDFSTLDRIPRLRIDQAV